MSDRYKRTFTGLMIDQHFTNAPFLDFTGFSAQEQVRKCRQAHVDCIHITSKCHAGHSYYDTKVGTKHPALGARDMVRELVDECRRNDIEAIIYYCLLFENLSVEQHPDWSMIDRDGRRMMVFPKLGLTEPPQSFRWKMPCINSPYRQYCLAQLGEIAGKYEIDGFFLDIYEPTFSDRWICYCDYCRAEYARHGIDLCDPAQRYNALRHNSVMWGEFAKQVRATIDRARPGLSLCTGGPIYGGHASLRQMNWIYCEGGESAFNPVIMKNLNLPYPQCGITAGAFVHDVWNEDVVRIQTSTVLAHGSRCFYFFTMGRRPDFTIEQFKYDILERVNSETKLKQPYIEGAQHPKCVAVYFNEETNWKNKITADASTETGDPPEFSFVKRLGKVIDAVRKTNLPCEVLPSWRLNSAEVAQYGLVIVPDMDCLSDAEIAVFEQYVRGGGTLLVSGVCGLYDENARPRETLPLHALAGLRFEGWCSDYSAQDQSCYLEYAAHPYFATLKNTAYLAKGDWPKFVSDGEGVISRIIPPIAVETGTNFLGWQSLPPAPTPSQYVGLAERRLGKGKIIVSSLGLRGQLGQGVLWPTELIVGILSASALRPTVTVEGPAGLELTFYRQKDRLVIHLLNQTVRQLGGQILPLTDVRVHIDRAQAGCGEVNLVWPEARKPQCTWAATGLTVGPLSVELHTILTVE